MAQILVQWPGNRPSLNRCPGAPTSTGLRGIAWRLYLGTGALATGAYYLLPEAGGAVLNVVVGASAVAAIATGIRWHRPARRLAWWLIAAAQGLFVVGDALFSVYELVLGIEPFPSLADALYLPGYPVLSLSGALVAVTDGMYLVDYLLLGAAGLHPSMAGLLEPARRRQARWAGAGCWP